jgi:hypothetical protein
VIFGKNDILVLIFTVLTVALGGYALYRGSSKLWIPFLPDSKRPTVEVSGFVPSLIAAAFGVALVAALVTRDIIHDKGMLQAWSDLLQDCRLRIR